MAFQHTSGDFTLTAHQENPDEISVLSSLTIYISLRHHQKKYCTCISLFLLTFQTTLGNSEPLNTTETPLLQQALLKRRALAEKKWSGHTPIIPDTSTCWSQPSSYRLLYPVTAVNLWNGKNYCTKQLQKHSVHGMRQGCPHFCCLRATTEMTRSERSPFIKKW